MTPFLKKQVATALIILLAILGTACKKKKMDLFDGGWYPNTGNPNYPPPEPDTTPYVFSDTLIYESGSSFRRELGGQWSDGLISVKPTMDGGYVFSGWTAVNAQQDLEILVIKINSNFDVEWHSHLLHGNPAFGHDIIETSAGHYTVAGQNKYVAYGPPIIEYYDPEWDNVEGFVIKTNATASTSNITCTYERITAIYPDGGEGYYYRMIDGTSGIETLKQIDPDGDEILVIEGNYKKIYPLDEGGFIACSFNTGVVWSGTSHCDVSRLSAEGTILWTTPCTIPDGYPLNIAQSQDGTFVLISADSPAPDYAISIKHFSAEGDLLNENYLEDAIASPIPGPGKKKFTEEFVSVKPTHDNCFVAATNMTFGTEYGGWVVKFRHNGEILWSTRVTDGSNASKIHCVEVTADNGVLAVGTINKNAVIVKLDASGN